ncbi:MAG TPA: polyprenyl synthetase family protein [Acidimicrobiia bacterium]
MADEASLLADVDRQLHRVVATFGEPVAGVLGPIAASGSRHRARLVLELARFGDRTLAVRGAAAVELLHLGTLVHDDIVDGSPVRRHSTTVHTALGMPVALWTADALYAEALHLADAVTPAGGVALGDALRRIADSQILEALGATTARYWDVVDGKTVSLFEASFALADEAAGGALAASLRDAVRGYGRLFQYVDDLQDIGGEADALGKPTGLDADNQLHTLPAADLVVSADAVRERLRELSGPIVQLASSTDWADLFARLSDRLLDAAGRVLDRSADLSKPV